MVDNIYFTEGQGEILRGDMGSREPRGSHGPGELLEGVQRGQGMPWGSPGKLMIKERQ